MLTQEGTNQWNDNSIVLVTRLFSIKNSQIQIDKLNINSFKLLFILLSNVILGSIFCEFETKFDLFIIKFE